MARSQVSDPLMSHNFALVDVPVAGPIPVAFALKTAYSAVSTGSFIGFKSISIPEQTIEMQEVKEGNWPFVHKVPLGFTTTGEMTISSAIFPLNVDMYLWFKQCQYGRVAPRRHLMVVYLKQDKIVPQRILLCEECLPLTWKPSGDLDGESAEVLIEELTVDVHNIKMIPLPVPVGSPTQAPSANI